MKKTSTCVALLLLLLCSAKAVADDFKLYYTDADGVLSANSWDVASLQKITFADGQMTLISTDGSSSSLSMSGIQKLTFFTDEGVTPIQAVQAEEGQPDSSAKPSRQGIYDLMGRRLSLSADQLHPGIYIINGKKTLIKQSTR